MSNTMPDAPAQRPVSAINVLLLLAAINAVNLIDRNMFGLLLEDIKRDIALTDAELGLLGGPAFAITYALAAIPLGVLADRYSRRNLIAAGLTFWSVVTALTGQAANAIQLFAARMFLGVGEASNMAPSSSLISDLFPERRRALALAVYTSGAPIGITIGFPLIGWLAQDYGWRVVFLVMGVLGVALAIALLLIGREPVREHMRKSNAPVPMKEYLKHWGELMRSRTFLLLTLAGVCLSVTNTIMNVWAPAFMHRVHDLDLRETGALLGLYRGMPGVVASILGGYLVSRLTERSPAWLARAPAILCIGMCAAELLFLWSPTSLGWHAGLIADTLLMSAAVPCTFALLMFIVDSRIRAFGAALYLLVFSLVGQSFGSMAVGALNDALADQHQQYAIRISMTLSPIAIALSGLVLFVLSAELAKQHRARDAA